MISWDNSSLDLIGQRGPTIDCTPLQYLLFYPSVQPSAGRLASLDCIELAGSLVSCFLPFRAILTGGRKLKITELLSYPPKAIFNHEILKNTANFDKSEIFERIKN